MLKNRHWFIVTLLVGIFMLAGSLTAKGELRVTVLYDNYTAAEKVRDDWGFSCLIQGAEKTILFDVGTRSDILQKNIATLEIDLSRIDMVIISHLHGDHIGGLEWVLSQKRDIPVFLPALAAAEYLAKIRQWGGLPLRVKEPKQICHHVFSTGEMPSDFDPAFTEQSLVFETAQGLLVITGCAHPGILAIVRRAPQIVSGLPRVVVGGFHLLSKSDEEIGSIIRGMKAAGVQRCGVSHCTGDRAIELFRDSFAGQFLPLGVGAVLAFPF
jgi:7,8-dihydropterin-6-yl-methyl-4-(beta-D-ribofuranosyl)aminobenzene 5'-phosphate synthase